MDELQRFQLSMRWEKFLRDSNCSVIACLTMGIGISLKKSCTVNQRRRLCFLLGYVNPEIYSLIRFSVESISIS